MRIIVDAQLPPALARHLRHMGYDCSHVYDLRSLSTADRAIWDFALRKKAVILTKDEDFAELRRIMNGGPPVIWVRIGNTANHHLMRSLLPRMSEIWQAVQAGEGLIEVR